MPKKTIQKNPPADEDILNMDNVPVTVAARYIGWSPPTLYRALQEERVPFGFAVQNPDGHWAYNISPGGLVKYKRGDTTFWRLGEVQQVAVEGIERILDLRTEAAKKAVNAIFN